MCGRSMQNGRTRHVGQVCGGREPQQRAVRCRRTKEMQCHDDGYDDGLAETSFHRGSKRCITIIMQGIVSSLPIRIIMACPETSGGLNTRYSSEAETRSALRGRSRGMYRTLKSITRQMERLLLVLLSGRLCCSSEGDWRRENASQGLRGRTASASHQAEILPARISRAGRTKPLLD